MTGKKVVRPKQARPLVEEEPLSPGDKYEFSITAEVKNRQGRSFWVKAGGVTDVRPGESTEDASDRLEAFVTEKVDAYAEEYLK